MSILDLLWLSKHRLRLYCQIFQNVSIMVTDNNTPDCSPDWLGGQTEHFNCKITLKSIFLNSTFFYVRSMNITIVDYKVCFYCCWIFWASINWWCCDILSPPRMWHSTSQRQTMNCRCCFWVSYIQRIYENLNIIINTWFSDFLYLFFI